MKLRIGPPATGSNYFPRLILRSKLELALKRGNFAFVGPRRTGKSSILRDLERNFPDDLHVCYLDLQGLRDVPSWIQRMLDAAKKALEIKSPRAAKLIGKASTARAVLDRIEQITLFGTGIKLTAGKPAVDDWQPMADQFVQLLLDNEMPLCFVLDEFPWFLRHVAKNHTAAETEAALNWFRAARQELVDSPCRFLISGSIGLNGLLRRLNLSPAANDFDTITIDPLTKDEAQRFLACLARGEGIPLDPAARDRILERLGGNWPMLLAILMSEIQDSAWTNSPTLADIDHIYDEKLVRGNRNKFCEEMWNRLKKPEVFCPGEYRLAYEFLKVLARADSLNNQQLAAIHNDLDPNPIDRTAHAQDVDVVIETLLHDGYIVRDERGCYRFSSNILRDYWRFRTA
jgi:uncharacterized protein